MRRLFLLIAFAFAICSFQGYSAGTGNAPAYDSNSTVDVKFKIVDEQGAPVANLCLNLEYKSGREGSYMPGDAISLSNGVVMRSAHPNATYTVYVTDRKMLDYEGKSTRNQMKYTVTVRENAKNKFKLVWKKPTPNELDIAAEKKVTLEFLDKNSKPVQDLWINMTSADDKAPEPRQIVPGLTDKLGRVYWTVPETGEFKLGALLFSGDDWQLEKSQQYTFTVKKLNSKKSFKWDPK